nr:RNA-directed DNA polymerase, eukaryota [Tanacetum cinerariifolium]
VAWVKIEGIPLNMLLENTFKPIAAKWGTLIHADVQEDKSFYTKRICINMNITANIFESFKIIYHDLEGDNDMEAVPDTKFDDEPITINTEKASVEKKEVHSEDPFNIYDLLNKKKENSNNESNLDDSLKYPPGFTPRDDNVASEGHSNKHTCECFHNIQEEGGTILQVMKELVKVGHTKGYNMEGCMKNIEEIIDSQGMLWDYLSHVMAQWEGDVVIMGDFNEVHKKDERFGSFFKVHGADAFNLFISNAGLEEVPLEGCSFTLCHKSASKMSKLDRFLIYESLMNSCPNISAITLDR